MTSVARGATHLVAKSVARTVKFLTGLSVVKHVVSIDWLERSVQEGRFLGEYIYINFCVCLICFFSTQK